MQTGGGFEAESAITHEPVTLAKGSELIPLRNSSNALSSSGDVSPAAAAEKRKSRSRSRRWVGVCIIELDNGCVKLKWVWGFRVSLKVNWVGL